MGDEEIPFLWEFDKSQTITFRIDKDLEKALKKELESKMESKKVKNHSAGTIQISNEKSSIKLYNHQIKAIEKLNDKLHQKRDSFFSGLLVLPTGGGKTLTGRHISWHKTTSISEKKSYGLHIVTNF